MPNAREDCARVRAVQRAESVASSPAKLSQISINESFTVGHKQPEPASVTPLTAPFDYFTLFDLEKCFS